MFKLTKFKICTIGMITGITLIGALSFVGLYVVIVRKIAKQDFKTKISEYHIIT